MSPRASGFSRSLRLTSASDYQQVFGSSRRFTDNCFLLLARKNNRHTARLGLAISKKRLRSAVQRNRVKRVIRESFRLHQQDLTGIDIVVLAQNNLLFRDNTALTNSLKKHWTKIQKCENF